MKKAKSILICTFVALLTSINIAYYSVNSNLPVYSEKTTATIDSRYFVGDNHFCSNSNIENTYHSYFERLCKFSYEIHFKLSYLKDFSENALHFIKELTYLNSSENICLTLDSPDIIFPFHYFW